MLRKTKDWMGKVRAEPIVENFLSLTRLGSSRSRDSLKKRVLHAETARRRPVFLRNILSMSQHEIRSDADDKSIVAISRSMEALRTAS
jgi:hypothetical protein